MAHSYPEPRKTRYGVLLIGVAIALCAFALGWVARLWVAPSSSVESGSPGPSVPSAASPPDQSSVAGPREDQLARCQQVFTAQDPPLTTGAASMTQWTEHITAMNKLVRGQIDLGQATAYWNQTRVGAQERLQAYADAVGRYDARTVRCPRAAAQASDDALSACARAVAARHHVLATLSTSLDTWRIHVRHMEMLRRGEMSPGRAVALWLKSWRQGQAQVRDYRAAAREAQGLGC